MKSYLYCIVAVFLLFAGCKDDPANTTNSDSDQTEGPSAGQFPDATCTVGITENEYPCKNIDLVGYVTPEDLMGSPLSGANSLILNDIWGWTDPQTDTEYALVGLNDGVTFVDISNPSEPVVVGKLNESSSVSSSSTFADYSIKHEAKSTWRDFKVYQNYLYVVSDAQPHGLQIFDLTRLRNVDNPPATFNEDKHYDEFGNAHNIAINEETGFAFVTGSDTYGGGLHIIDIRNPLDPQFAGFHSDSTVGRDSLTGYVHDTQCVVYKGPDTDYRGNEICMNSSETHLVIADVTEEQNTQTISKVTYTGNQYAHQGWLTEDHQFFLSDDELDELYSGNNTRTYIWDVRDLDDPQLINIHESEYRAIDHNQYVKGNYVYQSNYTAGLRILSLDNVASGELNEVAYFDTYPEHNDAFHSDGHAAFDGAWSNYPYFESGLVVVGDITGGLFILRPNL